MDRIRPRPLAVVLPTALFLSASPTASRPIAPPPLASGPRSVQASTVLEGRVVLGVDSTSMTGQTVVLHRVTPDSGFVVDSARSADDGTFRFSLPARADSATVHIVSARYRDAMYFGPVVHGDAPPDPYVVAVYDTARAVSGTSLVVERRTLALVTEESGTRVLDVMDVSSRADRTLVGPEEGEPWWRVSVPRGATDPAVLPGGIGPDQVVFGPGEARISASVPPTGRRLVLGYSLPSSGPIVLVVGHPVGALEVVHRGEGDVLPGAVLRPASPTVSEAGRFDRFTGSDLASGDTVRLELAGRSSGEGAPVAAWGLLALSGLLALAAWVSWRRTGRSSGPDGAAVGASK